VSRRRTVIEACESGIYRLLPGVVFAVLVVVVRMTVTFNSSVHRGLLHLFVRLEL